MFVLRSPRKQKVQKDFASEISRSPSVISPATTLNESASCFSNTISPESLPVWTADESPDRHLWYDTNGSGNSCFLGDAEFQRSTPRKKCAACKIVCHTTCISKLSVRCRATFREADSQNYREPAKSPSSVKHHWIERRQKDLRCNACGKSTQNKFFFKDAAFLQCTWCKVTYHSKSECLKQSHYNGDCSLGIHANLIIPPSWIVKIADPNSSQTGDQYPRGDSSTVASGRVHCVAHGVDAATATCSLQLYGRIPNVRILVCGGDGTVGWILSAIDSLGLDPLPPVAVLPLGTGNDLARTLHWGPGYTDDSLPKILSSVEGGRIVLLDRWNLVSRPLSYDKAELEEESEYFNAPNFLDKLPLNVINNYFSLGADAATALEFHESRAISQVYLLMNDVELRRFHYSGHALRITTRFAPRPSICDCAPSLLYIQRVAVSGAGSVYTPPPLAFLLVLRALLANPLLCLIHLEANPDRFNSRLKNKMFYAGVGGIDLIRRSWKDLSDYVTLVCDGVDQSSKLKELRPHVILFLNIPRYSAGTVPWGHPSDNGSLQRIDDKKIEVIGLTTAALASLQFGGHGDRICQCSRVHLTTRKVIPMQVDGEPCRLCPSAIEINLRNQAFVIQKPRRADGTSPAHGWSSNGGERSVSAFIIVPKQNCNFEDLDSLWLTEVVRGVGLLTNRSRVPASGVPHFGVGDDWLTTANKPQPAIPVSLVFVSKALLPKSCAAERLLVGLERKSVRQHGTTRFFASLNIGAHTDLSAVRTLISKSDLQPNFSPSQDGRVQIDRSLPSQWIFLDMTAINGKVFGIDQSTESSHFLIDILSDHDELFLIDISQSPPGGESVVQTVDVSAGAPERLPPSPASVPPSTTNEDFLHSVEDCGDTSLRRRSSCFPQLWHVSDLDLSVADPVPPLRLHRTVSSPSTLLRREAEEQIWSPLAAVPRAGSNVRITTEHFVNRASNDSLNTAQFDDTASFHTTEYGTLLGEQQQKRTEATAAVATTTTVAEIQKFSRRANGWRRTSARLRRKLKLGFSADVKGMHIYGFLPKRVLSLSSLSTPPGDCSANCPMRSTLQPTNTSQAQVVAPPTSRYLEGSRASSHSEQCLHDESPPAVSAPSPQLVSRRRKLSSAFLRACRDGDLEDVRYLLDTGVPPLSVDTAGLSGLHMACKYGHLNVVEYLLRTASPELLELRDFKKEQTALHKAAAYRRRRVCEALVRAGASLLCEDRKGQTPRLLALAAHDDRLALFLHHEELREVLAKEQGRVEI
ncbi:hypothetical protein SprV_0602063800 [Sparganum proliferum]